MKKFFPTLHPGAIATGLQKCTGGLYFEDRNEAQQVTERPGNFTGGYAAYAVDPESAERPP
jgi:hypothetical protein